MHEIWMDMSSDSDSTEYPRAPAQKARDENILDVFEATEDPVLTTAEVAEELPIGKRATLNRLEDLVDRGEITSKDVGVGRVWWRAEPEEPDPPDVPELRLLENGREDRTPVRAVRQGSRPRPALRSNCLSIHVAGSHPVTTRIITGPSRRHDHLRVVQHDTVRF